MVLNMIPNIIDEFDTLTVIAEHDAIYVSTLPEHNITLDIFLAIYTPQI